MSKRSTSKAALSLAVKKSPPQPADKPKTRKTASNSKQSRVIRMLQSPTGATIASIVETTGWQEHSVRGFFAGVVRKRLKLKLESTKVDGNRIYRVVARDGSVATSAPSKRRSA
jgi:hypothetical protein